HAMIAEAEGTARTRQLEIAGLEQTLAEKTRALADRLLAADALERDLRARDGAVAETQKRVDAAAARSEQVLADRQRELQRVAGLTAEEARDLLLKQIEAEMEETVRKEGEAAAFELGLYDLHPEILRLMGRLKFRTSYGQNVLNHSLEVAFLAGIMAKELGLNGHVAARAAFLHDIGKAIDRDLQGTHLELGLDFLRKHGESDPVLQAVAAHHMDIDWPSLE